ncbi:hypothetical protein HMPREF0321_2736 [Dermacoccus sp. Ellin185]|nr:hypothetical protein HMPREF0321_2736 [Dermacoccus sp. Ellin185]
MYHTAVEWFTSLLPDTATRRVMAGATGRLPHVYVNRRE